MAFTAMDVKALREKTGVGMMECKKALTEADGDMDKAIDFLRERGLAAIMTRLPRRLSPLRSTLRPTLLPRTTSSWTL